jgi:hypothetical protein
MKRTLDVPLTQKLIGVMCVEIGFQGKEQDAIIKKTEEKEQHDE